MSYLLEARCISKHLQSICESNHVWAKRKESLLKMFPELKYMFAKPAYAVYRDALLPYTMNYDAFLGALRSKSACGTALGIAICRLNLYRKHEDVQSSDVSCANVHHTLSGSHISARASLRRGTPFIAVLSLYPRWDIIEELLENLKHIING